MTPRKRGMYCTVILDTQVMQLMQPFELRAIAWTIFVRVCVCVVGQKWVTFIWQRKGNTRHHKDSRSKSRCWICWRIILNTDATSTIAVFVFFHYCFGCEVSAQTKHTWMMPIFKVSINNCVIQTATPTAKWHPINTPFHLFTREKKIQTPNL